jgi:signal transduction histidine kinase
LGQTLDDLDGTASLLSHDLKSPISVIISSLEVLLAFQDEDGLSDPSQRLLRGALQAAYRQLNLVNTLVDLPRLELGSYDLQLSEVDMAHLLRGVLEHETYTLDVKGLHVKIDITEQPVRVMADRDLIQEVISTLIDCVMKFTVRDDTMWINLDQQDGQAVLQLSDTGRPITPGFEMDIMRRAPQWEHRQAGARTSVALGLPFVYQVAQVHEGKFTAQSVENGKCTSFTFSLPALT